MIYFKCRGGNCGGEYWYFFFLRVGIKGVIGGFCKVIFIFVLLFFVMDFYVFERVY